MLAIPRWKYWLILTTCFFGVLFAVPNVVSPSLLEKLPSWLQNTINLGLELRGGSHLQFEVDLNAVSKEHLNQLTSDIRSALRKENIGYLNLAVEKNENIPTLMFSLRDPTNFDRAKKIIQTLDKDSHKALTIIINQDKVSVFYDEKAMEEKRKKLIEQSIEVIRRRIDETGTKEPIIQRQGHDRIIVQLPGIDDPAEVKKRIGKTAKMSFRIVDPNLPLYPIDPENPSLAPAGKSGIEYLPDHSLGKFLPVQKKVGVLGETLQDARVSLDPQNGKPNVSLEFNVLGARQFEQVTRENKGKLCAIVLDNEIISAPSLNVVIPNGRAVITSSSFTIQTANDLALLLRAGALPAPLKVVDERTIGPSLGADSIHDGKKAVFLAFIFVSVFMTLSYGIFGLFANISLLFNIIFLFSGLSLLQATLTLPGIAGIALTIGMAVDANVLIYERIKEELRAGLKPVNAVEAGYKLAMMTIIDSNITTLFGAAVLFEFGSGPIRGFAVTLALGILISLFTALSLSKLIIVSWLKRRKNATLPI